MNLESAKQSFLDHLVIERALSKNSVSAYRRDIEKFQLFLELQQLDYQNLGEDEILKFEISLKSSGLALNSSNRTISALKTFYKYLTQEFSIENPLLNIASAKIPQRLPKALTIAEVTNLISASKGVGDPISLRDTAIIEVLYGTGARVSEVIAIEVGDLLVSKIDGEEVTSLKLRGKGSKERMVPLGSFAKSAVTEYLIRTRPSLAAKGSGQRSQSALFLNQRGGRLSRQSAWQAVSDAAQISGLSGKVSPHVFRHSYATHLLDGGADIRVVQELLGHSSVTTTQIYTLITIDKVREAYATAHPRAR